MKGPFIATVDIGSPFKMTSEPYTIAGPPAIEAEIPGKRNLWPTIIVACLIVAFVLILLLRKRPTQ
jgi:hypothetical protein